MTSQRLRRLERLLHVLELQRQQHQANVAEKVAMRNELAQAYEEMLKRFDPDYCASTLVREMAIRQAGRLDRAMRHIDKELEPLREELRTSTTRAKYIASRAQQTQAEELAARTARELEEVIDGAALRISLERKLASTSST